MQESDIETLIITFKESNDTEFVIDQTMSSLLSSKVRRVIHELCEKYDLFSISSGTDSQRIITVSKENKREEIIITDEDRTRFIKDFSLPIVINKDPYFSYFIDLYNDTHSTKEKYTLFVKAVTELGLKGKTLHGYSLQLADEICSKIKNNPCYDEFISSKTLPNVKDFPAGKNIYSGKCENKVWVSLDIRTANFTAMKFYNPDLVLGYGEWPELIRSFTDLEYFIQSKHFRQILFGRLNTKKVTSVYKYLTNYLYQILSENNIIPSGASNDEILISSDIDKLESDIMTIRECLNKLPENMQNIWKVIPCYLSSINNTQSYIKRVLDPTTLEQTSFEIRNTDKDFYAQTYKYVTKKELEPYDMKSMKNGFIVTYEDLYIK